MRAINGPRHLHLSNEIHNLTMQKTELKDYIRAFDGVLTDDQCAELIARFEAAKQYDERRTDLYSFDQINCNTTDGWMDAANLVAMSAHRVASKYFASLGLSIVPSIQGFEQVRMKRYMPGRDEFREHIDVDDYESARRYLVCMIYLDDNEGGHTTFDGLGVSIECKRGRMAVFPPLWMFPHAGTPPVKKPKFTICTLLHYL